ncbi:MAG: DUF2723 domain-containing protein [Ignavibacteriales bacterium]|nr:DUF2723 domain-containing protein [Ignavibacteriales bacterium]
MGTGSMNNLRRLAGISLPTVAVVVVLLVYLKTLLPGVGYSGDTSKFQFVGKVLGTPHEPGSPTYVILNYLFVSLFPFGATAYKANLLSALFSALTLFVVARTLMMLGVRRSISGAVVLIFGFTYTLWSQSIIAEVYALNTLFVALTIHFFIRWHLTGKYSDFLTACGVYAFSFGVHLIVLMLLPGIVYLVWVTRREFFGNPRIILHVACIILLGAAQYGYLFWRYYAADTSYLEIAVPDLKTLRFYVSGGQFQSYFFAGGLKGFFFIGSPIILRLLWLEYLLLLPVSLIGFLALRSGRLKMFLLLCVSTTLLFTLLYAIADIFVYLLPVYLVVALMLGLALEWMFVKCPRRYSWLVGTVLAALPLTFFMMNYTTVDQSHNVRAKHLVEESIRVVGRNSLIVCPDYDFAEYYWYYVFAEGRERDSIYVLFSHDDNLPLHDLREYTSNGRPFYLPLERRNTPPGLTVYYCTAYQPSPIDRQRTRYPASRDMLDDYRRSFVEGPMRLLAATGYRFVLAADSLYRVEKPVR